MKIVTIDCQDGRPAVQVAVADVLEAGRLLDYLKWIERTRRFLDRVSYIEYDDPNSDGGYWRELTNGADIHTYIKLIEVTR